MTILVPDEGANAALEIITNKTAAQDLVLRLFQNDVTPAAGDTEASYTTATFSGYADITLTGASWGTAAARTIAYALQTFTHDGGGTANSVYGYILLQTTSGIVVGGERAATAPITMGVLNDKIEITPAISEIG